MAKQTSRERFPRHAGDDPCVESDSGFPSLAFEIDQGVVAHDLETAAMNGQVGKVVGFYLASKFYLVKYYTGGAAVKLNGCNLRASIFR